MDRALRVLDMDILRPGFSEAGGADSWYALDMDNRELGLRKETGGLLFPRCGRCCCAVPFTRLGKTPWLMLLDVAGRSKSGDVRGLLMRKGGRGFMSNDLTLAAADDDGGLDGCGCGGECPPSCCPPLLTCSTDVPKESMDQ